MEVGPANDFLQRLSGRSFAIGVVGLGYAGLPIAVAYANAGFTTIGYDISEERVSTLKDGISPIREVDAASVSSAITDAAFVPTTDSHELKRVDAIFLCVPTPSDSAHNPDLTLLRRAAAEIAETLRSGTVVVVQSTIAPGTTREVVLPILERSGLRGGQDFYLVYAPERIDPGRNDYSFANTTRLVAGLTPECAARGRALLSAVMVSNYLVRQMSSLEAAEMAKLLENIYRAVNIALVNELAVLSHEMQVDIWEVIDGAATKPFGFCAFYPGPGPGGHCVPIDPHYLAWRAREFEFNTRFIELATETNLRMAPYVKYRVQRMLNQHGLPLRGRRLLALGVSIKAGASDVRNSRAVRVVELLEKEGATVSFCDPYAHEVKVHGQSRFGLRMEELDYGEFDAVVILVGHPDWSLDEPLRLGLPVFDAVNATRGMSADSIERL